MGSIPAVDTHFFLLCLFFPGGHWFESHFCIRLFFCCAVCLFFAVMAAAASTSTQTKSDTKDVKQLPVPQPISSKLRTKSKGLRLLPVAVSGAAAASASSNAMGDSDALITDTPSPSPTPPPTPNAKWSEHLSRLPKQLHQTASVIRDNFVAQYIKNGDGGGVSTLGARADRVSANRKCWMSGYRFDNTFFTTSGALGDAYQATTSTSSVSPTGALQTGTEFFQRLGRVVRVTKVTMHGIAVTYWKGTKQPLNVANVACQPALRITVYVDRYPLLGGTTAISDDALSTAYNDYNSLFSTLGAVSSLGDGITATLALPNLVTHGTRYHILRDERFSPINPGEGASGTGTLNSGANCYASPHVMREFKWDIPCDIKVIYYDDTNSAGTWILENALEIKVFQDDLPTGATLTWSGMYWLKLDFEDIKSM